ncbi:MAG: hypothetical protein VKO00_06655 [Cyanobacteriota bacterium]|nr:hypothetical protein [Cyanobacteriota bacterium]
MINHCRIWDGEAFELLNRASVRLSPDQPLTSTIRLHTLVLFALSSERTRC